MGRVLLVDAVGTSFIESAAGVTDGGRTGLTSIIVGIPFLLAMILTPLAGMFPPQATATALIIVGFDMMSQLREIPWGEPDLAIPAFLMMFCIRLPHRSPVGSAQVSSRCGHQTAARPGARHPLAAVRHRGGFPAVLCNLVSW
jgi:AGZA family xanthine/uracil permease-like MFS transporter